MSDKYGGTISTFEFFERFPNERAAVEAIEARRWENGVVCPHCESERTTSLSGGYYHQCNNKECRKQFTVRTGTIFERSHIPLNKWLYAMYLLPDGPQGHQQYATIERTGYHSEVGLVPAAQTQRGFRH